MSKKAKISSKSPSKRQLRVGEERDLQNACGEHNLVEAWAVVRVHSGGRLHQVSPGRE